jgi:exopolysaccharide/PEP-CTERM locus tyrosine autokinase
MNDATPRRISGSLLERAAALYDLTPAAVPAAARVAAVAPPPAPPPAEAIARSEPDVARRVARRHAVAIDRDALAERGMIVPGAAVTALAEEFRLLKRQLLLTARTVAATDAQKSRMTLVCSARPDDGKTFCAVNLALSMAAEKDVEVVLVDADFAKPDVLESLGIDADGVGLLDALADATIDVEGCILDTDVPQLSILPAGTRSHNDTELLTSDRAHDVLDRLASANPRRIVIFDSPPALAASPAAVLAGHVGQVMLVVRADRTTESDLREAVALLDGCDQVQLLLNAVAFQPGGVRFGSYYAQGAAE